MNKKINLEGITFRYLYEKNKKYLLPLLVILASIVLFLQVTMPLFSEYSSSQELKVLEEQKLSTLRNNYNILQSADEQSLDDQLELATDALPPGKDFASILNAVTIAARNAGIILGDYEFQVGDLSKDAQAAKYPSLELALTVSGSVTTIINFMEQVYTSLPLAEIINVEMNNNRAVMTVVFYYKALPGTPAVTSPIQSLTPKNLTTLNTISTWNNGNLIENLVPVEASPSAITSPF
jgi:hypothetical protein